MYNTEEVKINIVSEINDPATPIQIPKGSVKCFLK